MSRKKKKSPKLIVVTGGVLSGLGKGIAAASIGKLLSANLKVVPIKCDGYLNTDPGTMNPVEHGEVYVQDDGGEVDMDFGHYERFIGVDTKFDWNITMGKVFKEILEKERAGDYLGKTVQFIPHVTDMIKEKIYNTLETEQADLGLLEIGGTVGDLENQFYIEAVRQLKFEFGPENIIFIHLTYVPVPNGVNEQKSKPTQMSVKSLQQFGIEPDIIIGRCSEYLTPKIKEKIALFCNLEPSDVISGVDVECIYEIPLIYEQEGLVETLHKKLNIYSPPKINAWRNRVNVLLKNIKNPSKTIDIAIAGKYTELEDSYASVVESITHSAANNDVKVNVVWLDTDGLETQPKKMAEVLELVDGVIVPGGFGARGIEGKISTITYCRENNIPFLGICYGMQLAVIEYARNVVGIKDANTAEILEDGIDVGTAVIDILPEQKAVTKKGGSMRLGGQDVLIKEGTKAHALYGATSVRQRFRHRYEVNPDYIQQIEDAGLVFSGHASDLRIMQLMELPSHPYFMACQFHPELTSRLETPSPLFYNLVKEAIIFSNKRDK